MSITGLALNVDKEGNITILPEYAGYFGPKKDKVHELVKRWAGFYNEYLHHDLRAKGETPGDGWIDVKENEDGSMKIEFGCPGA